MTDVYSALGFNNIHGNPNSGDLFSSSAPLFPPNTTINIYDGGTNGNHQLVAGLANSPSDPGYAWAPPGSTADGNTVDASMDTGYFKICGSTAPQNCTNNDWINTIHDNNTHDMCYYGCDPAYTDFYANLILSSGYKCFLASVTIGEKCAPSTGGCPSPVNGGYWAWHYCKPN
jgi:hypothetical protein